MLMLEVMKTGKGSNLEAELQKAVDLCSRATKKINALNTIQKVQESTFVKNEEEYKLLTILDEAKGNFDLNITIDTDSLNVNIIVDTLFLVLIEEIINFIQNTGGTFIHASGGRCSSNPNYFIITFSEYQNPPFKKNVCDKLVSGLNEEEWDYLGQNIEITLASIIAQYYGGKFGIYPSQTRGNNFCVVLPYNLIST